MTDYKSYHVDFDGFFTSGGGTEKAGMRWR